MEFLILASVLYFIGFVDDGIPSWEKKFCSLIGSVPWRKVVDAKKYIDQWCLLWHLSPDPNLYIDEIKWNAYIDPEVIKGLGTRSLCPPMREIQVARAGTNGILISTNLVILNKVDNPWERGFSQESEAVKGKTWGVSVNPWQHSRQGVDPANDKGWGNLRDCSRGYNQHESRKWNNDCKSSGNGFFQGSGASKDRNGKDNGSNSQGWKQWDNYGDLIISTVESTLTISLRSLQQTAGQRSGRSKQKGSETKYTSNDLESSAWTHANSRKKERTELDFKKLEICKHLHEGRECWWCNVVMRLASTREYLHRHHHHLRFDLRIPGRQCRFWRQGNASSCNRGIAICFTFSRKLLATEKGSFEVERNLFGPFNLGGAGRSCGFSVGASKGFCGGARDSFGEIVGVGGDLGIQWIMPLTDWAWISIIKLPIVGWKMECIGKMLQGFARLVGFDKTSVQSPALFALRILVGTKNVEILNTVIKMHLNGADFKIKIGEIDSTHYTLPESISYSMASLPTYIIQDKDEVSTETRNSIRIRFRSLYVEANLWSLLSELGKMASKLLLFLLFSALVCSTSARKLVDGKGSF
ncbi:hypothetical protein D5086_000207 [Populus alba]|uniref:Uncharacterized protein n=1 Tax=Populus alba TaxID=43335 RepID=A0ACC4CVC0_POPAL